MELIVVPPEFALLFFVPIAVFAFLLYKGKDLSLAVFSYLTFQIGLCILARFIYA